MAVPAYKINMPVFVKRARKAIDAKNVDVLHEKFNNELGCFYSKDGRTCIIGAGLPDQVVRRIKARGLNESTVDTLVDHGVLALPEKYADRLVKLQQAHDEGDAKLMRGRFRHLEASVKRDYPNSFKN